jgi:tRNA dimethylallyltransferase
MIGIGLTRPRPELYERIDERIEQMFQRGFLEEVQGLIAAGYSPSLPSMTAIGYKEASQVVKGEWSLEKAKMETKRRTRIFVRRQANWFKESDPKLHWFYAGDPILVDKIESWLKSNYRQNLINSAELQK